METSKSTQQHLLNHIGIQGRIHRLSHSGCCVPATTDCPSPSGRHESFDSPRNLKYQGLDSPKCCPTFPPFSFRSRPNFDCHFSHLQLGFDKELFELLQFDRMQGWSGARLATKNNGFNQCTVFIWVQHGLTISQATLKHNQESLGFSKYWVSTMAKTLGHRQATIMQDPGR